MMRDFNPYRVQRTLALSGGEGREVKLECGSVVKARLSKSRLCIAGVSGSGTEADIDGHHNRYGEILMDEVVEVRTEVSHVHVHLRLRTD
jgi:hypothetical protein